MPGHAYLPIDLKSHIEEISSLLPIAGGAAVNEHARKPVARLGLFASEGDFIGQTEGGLEMVLGFVPAPARAGGDAGNGPQEVAGVHCHNGVGRDRFHRERVKLGGPVPLAKQRKSLDRFEERFPGARAIERAGARETVTVFVQQGKALLL